MGWYQGRGGIQAVEHGDSGDWTRTRTGIKVSRGFGHFAFVEVELEGFNIDMANDRTPFESKGVLASLMLFLALSFARLFAQPDRIHRALRCGLVGRLDAASSVMA
jgi:hypothetical protein